MLHQVKRSATFYDALADALRAYPPDRRSPEHPSIRAVRTGPEGSPDQQESHVKEAPRGSHPTVDAMRAQFGDAFLDSAHGADGIPYAFFTTLDFSCIGPKPSSRQ